MAKKKLTKTEVGCALEWLEAASWNVNETTTLNDALQGVGPDIIAAGGDELDYGRAIHLIDLGIVKSNGKMGLVIDWSRLPK